MKKTGKLVGVCNCECHCGLEECFTNHDDMCECCIDKSGTVNDVATKKTDTSTLKDIKAIIEGKRKPTDWGRKAVDIAKNKAVNKIIREILQAINEYKMKENL